MKSFIMIMLSIGLMILFQNCDKVAFDAERMSQSETAFDSSSSEDINDVADEDLDPAIDPSTGGNPGTNPVVNPVANPPAVNSTVDSDHTQALADCEALKTAQLDLVASGASIKNNIGALRIKGDRIESIDNNMGSVQVLGIGQNASMGNFSNASGRVLICNMDVELIGVSRGSIRVVGGNISQVTGEHLGSITIYDGSIGDISNSSGSVTIKNGDLGNVNDHRGSITIHNGQVTGTITNHTGSLTVN